MEMEGEEEKKEEYKGKKGGGKLRQEETSVCMFVCIPGGLMGVCSLLRVLELEVFTP